MARRTKGTKKGRKAVRRTRRTQRTRQTRRYSTRKTYRGGELCKHMYRKIADDGAGNHTYECKKCGATYTVQL